MQAANISTGLIIKYCGGKLKIRKWQKEETVAKEVTTEDIGRDWQRGEIGENLS